MHFSASRFSFYKFIYLFDVRTKNKWNTVSRLTAHIVWSTKYRYSILEGDIQQPCRTILVQVSDAEDVVILKGVDIGVNIFGQ